MAPSVETFITVSGSPVDIDLRFLDSSTGLTQINALTTYVIIEEYNGY